MRRPKIGKQSRRLRQKQRFLIVSEGSVTEFQYLNAVKRARKILTADLEFIPPGPTSPVEIVSRARDLKRASAKSDPFDHVWCIFDVEAKADQKSRPKIAEALDMARANRISVAVSNPCVELWILLHAREQSAWIASHACQSECAKLQLTTGKHLRDADQLFQLFEKARSFAIRLEQKHDGDNTRNIEDRNPSSRMYLLIDEICNAFPADGK